MSSQKRWLLSVRCFMAHYGTQNSKVYYLLDLPVLWILIVERYCGIHFYVPGYSRIFTKLQLQSFALKDGKIKGGDYAATGTFIIYTKHHRQVAYWWPPTMSALKTKTHQLQLASWKLKKINIRSTWLHLVVITIFISRAHHQLLKLLMFEDFKFVWGKKEKKIIGNTSKTPYNKVILKE